MTVMPLFDYNNSRYRPEKSNPLRQDVKRHYNRLANSLGQWSWYNNSDVSGEIIERVPHWAAKVADLGCGPGILAYELLRSRPALDSFYAIDISPKMIGLASGRISKFAVAELVESDWLTQAYDVRNLDCVILKNILHVLADPQEKLLALKEVLARNGIVIVCETISPNLKCNKFIRKLFHFINAERYKTNFYTEHALVNQMENAGLRAGFKTHGKGQKRERTRKLVAQQLILEEWLDSKCLTPESKERALKFISENARDNKLRRDMCITFDGAGRPYSMIRLQYIGSFHPERGLFH